MRRLLVGVTVGMGLLAGCATRATRPTPEEQPEKPPPSRAWLEEGLASYYGPGLAGRPTASGEKFNPKGFTAAHRKLPFGSCLRVVNMENGRSVEVRVNDRGPFVQGRVVDVSTAAAKQLGMMDKGLARVRLYRCADRTS
ncbi:septal ring lytic transglycosylase RlpA family protein [Vitiosangium sp. GDMCC 1.1324]|uniref:septal ring lytic transglycosylase RlpA family protein n=1 Tax=Vitiosangium sp. (strain GDMCC 1.1324) TaxID=2138576 RepID=UPI000D38DE80|nr:septal ring lytic transglycosylase RlpA family protein [Vitiosangium sp. GDMCC 1.1324]PTL80377.1 septal ring lytic transglycosylase RlpA family lipoprotein [Vitiosangium sp. GDMCC 1.1324]